MDTGDASVNRVHEFVETSLGCTIRKKVEEHWPTALLFICLFRHDTLDSLFCINVPKKAFSYTL